LDIRPKFRASILGTTDAPSWTLAAWKHAIYWRSYSYKA
jgi:hypothetical protein